MGRQRDVAGSGVFGVEGDVAITPGYFQGSRELVQSSRVATLLANIVVAAPLSLTRESLRPYASAGWGLMRATSTSIDALAFSRNLSAFNVGGGVIGMSRGEQGCGGICATCAESAAPKGEELYPAAPSSYWRATGLRDSNALAANQRSVNVSSIVTSTATACPNRVPGANRHCFAAFSASSSRPNVESSDRTIFA